MHVVQGRWVFFKQRGVVLHDFFCTMERLTKSLPYVTKVTSTEAHFHTTSAKLGTVHVYCEMQQDSPTTQLQQIGSYLAGIVNYTSRFGILHCEKPEAPYERLCSVKVPYGERTQEWKMECPTQNMVFHIPQDQGLALHLGAKWDEQKQHWYAPTRSVWNKLIPYFKQESQQMDLEPDTCKPSPIYTIMSFNICFNTASNIAERMLVLFSEIERLLPDIVCLQEMTQEAVEVLHPLLTTLHYITHAQLASSSKIGVVLYIRKSTFHILQYDQMPFLHNDSSLHERHLHIVHVECAKTGTRILCATAHLETGAKAQDKRRRQFEHAIKTLRTLCQEQQNVGFVFAGDTNLGPFDQHYTDSLLEANQVIDAWKHCGSWSGSKITWHPRANTNLQRSQYALAPCRRFDRVFLSQERFMPLEFSLCCTEPSPLLNHTHISDHFGIMCRFQTQ